MIATTDSGNM